MIDYVAVVQDLHSKRAAIDQVLDGLQQLAGTASGNGTRPAPHRLHAGVHKAPTSPAPRDTRRKTLAPELLAKLKKRWWDGEPRSEIAEQAGVSVATLYKIAKRERWPKAVVQP